MRERKERRGGTGSPALFLREREEREIINKRVKRGEERRGEERVRERGKGNGGLLYVRS